MNQDSWEQILSFIKLEIGPKKYDTWFPDISFHSFNNNILTINVKSVFAKRYINDKFYDIILKNSRKVYINLKKIDYFIGEKIQEEKKNESSFNILKGFNFPIISEKETGLNPKYNLDDFVVGKFNELAYAAAENIINNNQESFKILYIYGNTGNGKTHLIQSIGNKLKKSKKVFYISTDKFIADFVNQIKRNSVEKLKEKYSKVDILIVDDVQFLKRTDAIQEDFFYIINQLYEKNKTVILSSDRLPREIENLFDRLCSRFSSAPLIDIQKPELESRIKIFKLKLKKNKIEIKDELVDYLAQKFDKKNIREIEGCVNDIKLYYEINKKIDKDNIRNILEKRSVKTKISSEEIIKRVSEIYNIQINDLLKRDRRKEFIIPRQILMFILKNDLGVTYEFVGKKIGNRNHATVLHSCRKIQEELDNGNVDIDRKIKEIRLIYS